MRLFPGLRPRPRLRAVLWLAVLVLAFTTAVAEPALATPARSAAAATPTADEPSAYCNAGRWVQVRGLVHPFGVPVGEFYVVNPGVFVEWQWFQDGVPQYWYNAFTSSANIIYTPSLFTSVQFKCSVDSPVWIYPLQ